MFALYFLRVLFSNNMELGIEMALIDPPIIGIKTGDPKGL